MYLMKAWFLMINHNIKNNSKVPLTRIICCCMLISCAIIFIVLFAIHFLFPGYLSSFDQPLIITKKIAVDDEMTLLFLGKLINEKTLLSVDDFWGYLGSFYQTIVTILIAVNAIIATFAFLIINNGSKEKAMEAAINHTQTYINGSEFSKSVSCAAEDFLKNSRNDFNEATELLQQKLDLINDRLEKITECNDRIDQFESKLTIIIDQIAKLDTNDNENDDHVLTLE